MTFAVITLVYTNTRTCMKKILRNCNVIKNMINVENHLSVKMHHITDI